MCACARLCEDTGWSNLAKDKVQRRTVVNVLEIRVP
jgi:hypothetical protein